MKRIIKYIIFFFSYLGCYYLLALEDDQKLAQVIVAAVVSVIFFAVMSAGNIKTIFESKE